MHRNCRKLRAHENRLFEPFSTAERNDRVENFLFCRTCDHAEAMRRPGASRPEPRRCAAPQPDHISTARSRSASILPSSPGLLAPFPVCIELCAVRLSCIPFFWRTLLPWSIVYFHPPHWTVCTGAVEVALCAKVQRVCSQLLPRKPVQWRRVSTLSLLKLSILARHWHWQLL